MILLELVSFELPKSCPTIVRNVHIEMKLLPSQLRLFLPWIEISCKLTQFPPDHSSFYVPERLILGANRGWGESDLGESPTVAMRCW